MISEIGNTMRLIIIALIITSICRVSSFENAFLQVFTPGIDMLVDESIGKIETYENVVFNYTISCNKSLNLLSTTRNISGNVNLFSKSITISVNINDTNVVNYKDLDPPFDLNPTFEIDCENQSSEVIELNSGYIGITKLNLEITDAENSFLENVEVEIRIKRKVTLFEVVSLYILAPLVLINKCAFGAKIDINTLVHIFTQPIALILCLLLQFVLMPLCAYVYGLLFHLNEAMALALFVGATCPGGGGGYIFSYLIGGDVTLAISASLMSTLVAMAAMPATIAFYTYMRNVPNNLVIPYVKMVLILLVIAVTISTGMFINKKWPDFAKKFVKIIRPLSIFLIICGFAVLAVSSRYIIQGPPVGWILAILLPASGFAFSLFIGRCFGLSWPFSKAISLETGMKNTLLGIAVIELTYPQPEADLSSILIIMVTLGHTSLSVLWYFCYLMKEKMCDHDRKSTGFVKLENLDSDEDDFIETDHFLLEKN